MISSNIITLIIYLSDHTLIANLLERFSDSRLKAMLINVINCVCIYIYIYIYIYICKVKAKATKILECIKTLVTVKT